MVRQRLNRDATVAFRAPIDAIVLKDSAVVEGKKRLEEVALLSFV